VWESDFIASAYAQSPSDKNDEVSYHANILPPDAMEPLAEL
jgi:hypothetical protein